MSERLACRVLGQHRSTQRKMPMGSSRRGGPDRRHHRAGHPVWALRATGASQPFYTGRAGWQTRSAWSRIWRGRGSRCRTGSRRRAAPLNDGSCIRLRPEYPNHVWSCDFVEDRTHNGKKFRMLNVIDEFTRSAWRSASTASSTRLRHRRPIGLVRASGRAGTRTFRTTSYVGRQLWALANRSHRAGRSPTSAVS